MGSLLRRWLGFSRTRLFVAVLVPCLIGASAAYRDGFFSLGSFALMAFGLVMVESSNLFLADWATFGGGSGIGEAPPPMEGSPMLPAELLPTRYTVHASAACLCLAAVTMLSFAAQRGVGILLFGAAAVAIGVLYAFSPVRYGFFSTALLPPLISLGAYYVLAGSATWGALLVGVPNMLLSAAVIFTYRVLYGKGGDDRFTFHARVMMALYLLGFATLLGFALFGLVPVSAAAGLIVAPLLALLAKTYNDRIDYVPATSMGVTIYAAAGLLISLGCTLL